MLVHGPQARPYRLYHRNMGGKRALVAGAVILAAALAGAFLLLRDTLDKRLRTPGPVPASTANGGLEVTLAGRVRAIHVVPVAAPIAGLVESFAVDVGDEVQEGQVLAQIRNTGLESERDGIRLELERARARVSSLESRLLAERLEATRARVDAARAREAMERTGRAYQRQQLLFREGATPRLKYEQSEKDNESAKTEFTHLDELARIAEEQAASLVNELDTARRALAGKTRAYEDAEQEIAAGEVVSPADGLVVGRRGEAGQEVGEEVQDFFQVAVNLSSLEIAVEPEPAMLLRIHPGQEAAIQLAGLRYVIQGKVREVKEQETVVEFTSPGADVRPGMTAQVRIKLP